MGLEYHMYSYLIRFHVVNTEDIESQWEEIYIQCGCHFVF